MLRNFDYRPLPRCSAGTSEAPWSGSPVTSGSATRCGSRPWPKRSRLAYMLLTRTVHPPACAPGDLVHAHAGLWQPVFLGVFALAAAALVWSRLAAGLVHYLVTWLEMSPPSLLWGAGGTIESTVSAPGAISLRKAAFHAAQPLRGWRTPAVPALARWSARSATLFATRSG